MCSPQMTTPARGLLRPVLVLVVAVEQVRVADLLVGGVDGHLCGTRLLQVADTC